MRFRITHTEHYLRGDLYDRETAEETSEFLQALAAKAVERGYDRVLISIHSSRAIFRVQQFGLPDLFNLIATRPAHRIALVADSLEVRLAQQYVVALARIKGLAVRSFGSEEEAIGWLTASAGS